MTFTFRPAARENVGLLIGLAGGTGSGKTFSAMELASGIAGDKPFAVIDTEAGRAKHYADRFKFDHGDLKPPFRPDAYIAAIRAADEAGYPVIVVDSASHEHAGEGGLLDWHEEELQRMAGDDWKRREACKMAAWIKPKTSHKAFVSRLLQVRAHLILCFRAEEKVEMRKNEQGRMEIVPKVTRTGRDGWVPICEKNLPFEMTCSFLLLADQPGVPHPIKLEEQHQALFPSGKRIGRESGRLIAQWAGGAPLKSGAGAAAKSDDVPFDAVEEAKTEGPRRAAQGTDALREWWKGLPNSVRKVLAPQLDRDWKPAAATADDAAKSAPAHDAEELVELLEIKIEDLPAIDSLGELKSMSEAMRKTFADHPDLLGRWNHAALSREQELSRLKTARTETHATDF